MPEFEKIKVSTNEQEFQLQLATYEGRIEFYQNVINSIKEIFPNFLFSVADLKKIFDNPKAYLVDSIITEPMTIGGLELSKDKIFEILEDSERLKSVVDYVEQLKKNIKIRFGKSFNTSAGQFSEEIHIHENERNLHMHTQNYEINSQDEVILKQSTIDDLQNQYSIFVKTQRQKDAHDSLLIILQELKKLGTTYSRSHMKFIEENLVRNSHGEFLGINYKYIHILE